MWSWPEAEEAVRHSHAAAPDHGESTLCGHGHCRVRVRPRLEPDHFRADRDRFARDGFGLGRWTEHVDDVDRHVDVAQRCERVLAEDLSAARIHRNDPVPLRLEIARLVVRRFADRARGADDRDGPRLRVDAQQLLVGWPLRGRIRHGPTVMDSTMFDRLADLARARADRALLADALARLDERYAVARKAARDPELEEIRGEFITRLERPF